MRQLKHRALRCGAVVAGVALLVPFAGAAGAAEDQWTIEPLKAAEGSGFVTLAGTLQEPPVLSTTGTGLEDPGYLLTTPGGGGVMYDNNGEAVWIQSGAAFNFEQTVWQGEPALVMYTPSRAAHVVVNQSYEEVDAVSMVDQPTDGHDVEFSPDGTRVLVEGWAQTTVDLSPWGGSTEAMVGNPVIQEQDVATGEVLFEWSALDHVSPDESTEALDRPRVDLFHLNSVSYDSDGNILASFRNTSTVYKIDIETGEIIWRLGGKQSDFTFPGGEADMPSYQHDAQRLPDGRLSVFDNGNAHDPQESRGLIYTLDEATMTATLSEDLRADPPAFTPFIGSNRQVSNGNQLVSFGATSRMVEFADGEEVFSAQFEQASTYRAVRTTDWTGTPAAAPDVVVRDAIDGSRELYVSWNGATDVEQWRIEAGPSEGELTEVGVTPKTGFETGVNVLGPEEADVFRVTALDDSGKALHSRTLTAP